MIVGLENAIKQFHNFENLKNICKEPTFEWMIRRLGNKIDAKTEYFLNDNNEMSEIDFAIFLIELFKIKKTEKKEKIIAFEVEIFDKKIMFFGYTDFKNFINFISNNFFYHRNNHEFSKSFCDKIISCIIKKIEHSDKRTETVFEELRCIK